MMCIFVPLPYAMGGFRRKSQTDACLVTIVSCVSVWHFILKPPPIAIIASSKANGIPKYIAFIVCNQGSVHKWAKVIVVPYTT